ncbi:AAA family ATPase [Kribbella sp. NPDC050281]|uniref:helix-turn-helix transcriptional regulator n=1 Tax=Kribbella sp. NPDC050281 TaxID=3155515 RepID=UPI0033C3F693
MSRSAGSCGNVAGGSRWGRLRMVGDESQGAAPVVGGLDRLLLDAKLSVPQARPGSVSRTDLIEAARASRCRVVGITASAGYGKSTLLAQWARAESRRIVWVSLDRFDDDPALLLSVLATAYARVSPADADLLADLRSPGVSPLARGAPRLASVLRTSPAPFVLMLDDLHELRSSACHDVLGVVISGIPRGSQLVSASRSEQPHIPRLRSAADVVELGAAELALDAVGAEQIFAAVGVQVAPDVVAGVTARTEGWPAGLYLAAAIAHESHGQAVDVSGEDRYVTDYLYRESLSQLPGTTQAFLRRTAVLDQLHAPLCDALLGESGGQQQLRTIEASNSFLIPLDRRRLWYRYHALFREFLLGELRRVEPEVVMKLHLRAADWYESNGSPVLALEHLLNTTERSRCVRLVTALALPTYSAGQITTVQRWLSALGDSAIEQYPPLAVLAGWITALAGHTREAQRWAAIVDAASFELVPADGTASFDSARAMLRAVMCASGPEQMLIDANLALAQEPPWSPWRDTALCMSAEAHLLFGDVDEACELFVETSAVAEALGNTDTIVDSESELASMEMDRGRWAQAGEHVDRALALIDEHRMHDYATSVIAFAQAARLAVHRGDLKEADRQLTNAMRARPACTFVLPFFAVRGRLQLAKVYWSIGDATTARHLLREIDDVLIHRPALGALVDEVSDFRRIVTSSAQTGASGGSPLTPAELRLLPYLQTHLTIGEIGHRLFVSRNTVSSEVASIYRKLGVSSRNDAVQHATAIGLLGG